ncbi:iron-containing alcohol dehydrogenase [Streptomyces sp. NPDC052015]|uniref:iron-containing alcohol dehydrogenase n=1 Tax=Streptomyces sp. NPDC052015 TaxID=3154755 RepID=UPI00341480A4
MCWAAGTLPHTRTHAVVPPYVLAFNASATPDAERRIADALGAGSAVEGPQRLRRAVDAPQTLRDHGFGEAHIEDAVQAILEVVPANNPAP